MVGGCLNPNPMERLIYSNTIPSKIHLKRIPFFPRVSTPHPKLTSFSPFTRFEWCRVNSLSCNCQDPSYNSVAVSSKSADTKQHCADNSSSSVDLPDGSPERVHFLRKVVESLTQQQKVFNLLGFDFLFFPDV